MVKTHSLFLIPTDLGYYPDGGIYSPSQIEMIHHIRFFVAEQASTARAALKKCAYPHKLQDIPVIEFNEHTRGDASLMKEIAEAMSQGLPMGLMSEAGLPCVADPGHEVVMLAHRMHYKVVPMHGPSSLMQALMASGFSGQQFVFHGYVPVRPDARKASLRRIMKRMQEDGYTQIIMEAPYRNNALLQDMIAVLDPNTYISIACEIGTPDEVIRTEKVIFWRQHMPDLHKKRCVFVLAR